MAKLFRRGRIWYAWVPGRGGGVRKQTTYCTDKRAAGLVLARLEREAADSDYAAANKVTTESILQDYLDSRRRMNRAAGTLSFVVTKSGHLKRLLPARAACITHAVLVRYFDTRVGEGAAPATAKKELGVLRGALRLARRNKLFRSEVSEVMPEVGGEYIPRKRALTHFDAWSLVDYFNDGRGAATAFMIGTGARWSECAKARAADVGDGFVILHGTKTKGAARRVPVTTLGAPFVREARAWLAEHDRFPGWGNVRRDLRVACAARGLAPVSPNDLRRTFATWLRAAGVEPTLIGAALGHTTSRMVELVYGKLEPEALAKLLAARLGDGSLMGGDRVQSAPLPALPSPHDTAENTGSAVARGGIEPPTRGFSALGEPRRSSTKAAKSEWGWVANGSDSAAGKSRRSKGPAPLARCAAGLAVLKATDPDDYAERVAAGEREGRRGRRGANER